MQILGQFASGAKRALLFSTLTFTALTSHAQERPASLVLKDTFGSDPYKVMAYHEGTLLVTGKLGAGAPNNSRNLDILQYTDSSFELLGQYQLDRTEGGFLYSNVVDIAYQNGFWIILGYSEFGRYYLSTASLSAGELTIIDEIEVELSGNQQSLISGDDDNIYLFSSDSAMRVIHYRLSTDGEVTQASNNRFGTAPSQTATNDDFSVTFNSQRFYVTSNQNSAPAFLYRIPVSEDGSPGEATALTLSDAQASYRASEVRDDLWFLSYHPWGFHVAQMTDDTLNIIFEYTEDSDFRDIEFNGNYVYALDAFSEVSIFEIDTDNTIAHVADYATSGFLGAALIDDNTLIFTRDFDGIEAAEIQPDATLVNQTQFSQSGQILDIDKEGDELAIAALDSNIHFWSLSTSTAATLDATFSGSDNIQGVAINGTQIVINDGARFESHSVSNMKANIDAGVQFDSVGSAGRDGQIIELDNGYVAQAFDQLSFIDSDNNLQSTIVFDTDNIFNFVQGVVAANNLLFVSTFSPSEVIIYDTSDLTNVTELSRIEQNGPFRSNVAVSGSYLFVPFLVEGRDFGVTPYDITTPSTPVAQQTVTLGESNGAITLFANDDYLLAATDRGYLLDISAPQTPVLVDENRNISSNGIGIGFGSDLFTVSRRSSGVVHQSQVNLAPQHADISITLEEDGQGSVTLSPVDNENDDVTYTIVTPPEKGGLSVQDNTSLIFTGDSNENGDDTAQILVSDPHGGATQFNVAISINPVNDAPELETTTVSAIEDTTANVTLVASDIDSNTDDIVFSLVTAAMNGEAQVSAQGVMTYLPTLNYNGQDTVEIQIEDSDGATSLHTVSITVTPINDNPEYTGDTQVTGNEDETVTINLAATDIDGDNLTYEVVTAPTNWMHEIDSETLTLTPNSNDNGDFTVVIAVMDGEVSVEHTIGVSLNPINDAPQFDNDTASISTLSGNTSSTTVVATDVDGDDLVYSISEAPTKGEATVDEAGTITYTANAGETGADSLTITATDSEGATATKTVSVSISAVPVTPPASSGDSGGGSLHWIYLSILTLLVTCRRVKR